MTLGSHKEKNNKGTGDDKESAPHSSQDKHAELYNTAIQCLQNYCVEKAEGIQNNSIYQKKILFDDLTKEIHKNERIIQEHNKVGTQYLRNMRELISKTQEFNTKYLAKIIERQQSQGMFKSFLEKFKGGESERRSKAGRSSGVP